MGAQHMTVEQVDAMIAGARARLADLEKQAKELSLPAVSGDESAITDLGRNRDQVRQVLDDLIVLDHARRASLEKQTETDAAAVAAFRAQRMEAARGHAAEIVALAGRADELVAGFKVLLADLAEAERNIWRALNDAKAGASSAIVGRRNIGNIAVGRMLEVINGVDRMRSERSRPVAVIASIAWADDLLKTEGESND